MRRRREWAAATYQTIVNTAEATMVATQDDLAVSKANNLTSYEQAKVAGTVDSMSFGLKAAPDTFSPFLKIGQFKKTPIAFISATGKGVSP